jgi:integrase
MKLNQRTVGVITLSEGSREKIFFDETLPGFGLRLREGGSRMYVVQYKIGGRTRRMVLGSTALIGPGEARAKAGELLAKVKLGTDPAGEKAEAQTQAGETFATAVRRYLIRQKAHLRPSSYINDERYLLDHFAPLHRLILSAVDRRAVAERLSEIATKRGPASADRARASLSAFFTWAMREGLVDANPVIATNTHRTIKSRDRVLSEGELAEVWRLSGDDAYGTVIKLLILTGQRRNEIGSLKWSEVDLSARMIHLPAARAKNHQPHDVPLSEPAMRLLQALPRQGAFVLGTASNGFCAYSDGKAALDQRITVTRQETGAEPMPAWVIHDLRRSVATHMAEIGVQPHIVEAVLNHASGHKAGVAGTYNKATYERDKRQALDLWGERVMALVEGRGSNVVPLRA